jgi:hypothetical protein
MDGNSMSGNNSFLTNLSESKASDSIGSDKNSSHSAGHSISRKCEKRGQAQRIILDVEISKLAY